MNKNKIDFNKPVLTGKEFEYIHQAFNNAHISGDGIFTKKCQGFIEGELDVQKVILTTSCTHALEMSAILVDIQPGDEVIFPSFTFVSTINAFVLRGAKPVFADIKPDTLNMNEKAVEDLITDNTKAIVPVHYAGVACEMDEIKTIAEKHHLAVIEDNAHGLFAKYKGRYLGTLGDMATQSFHETKNFTCGEGGALIINNEKFNERAEIIREKGTNRSRFYRGMVDKYTWVDIGSSYLPSDILAAVLYAQLESKERIQNKRKEIWDYYDEHLKEWASDHNIKTPFVPDYCEQAYHMYYMVAPSLEIRSALLDHLKTNGILSVFHYQPLHLSAMGIGFGGKEGDCPVTERVSDCLLRLPFYNKLSIEDQDYVISTLKKFEF